jgi:hypothetical protein
LLLHYKGISFQFQDYKIPSFKKEKDLKTWKAMKPSEAIFEIEHSHYFAHLQI